MRNAGSIVYRFWQRLRRLHIPRQVDLAAAPNGNTPVEIEESHSASQPPPQEVQAQGFQVIETLLESLALCLANWLSYELTEWITVGVDAHFKTCRHAHWEEISKESAHRAVDALLDFYVLFYMTKEVTRAAICSQIAMVHHLTAIKRAYSIQERFSESTHCVNTGGGEHDTATP